MPDSSVIVLWSIALVLGVMVVRRSPRLAVAAAQAAGQNLVAILPRLAVALILAGFIGKLIPGDAIGHLIGHDSGWRGLAVATLFGGMMPSGPMIAFPVVVVLRHADAGLPQVVAFLTAWSVFAWHRVLIYEATMLGWQFVSARLAASLVLPLVAGAIAVVLCAVTGMR